MQLHSSLACLVLLLTINYIHLGSCQSLDLLKVESDIISGLEKYINDYEKRIDILKSNLEELKKEHQEADEDVTKYLSNPVNAYLLTKRLTTDWKHVEEMINADQNVELFKNLTTNFGHDSLPSEEDLRNEILRLDQLRKTYNLPISDVANGYLDGAKYSEPLLAVDCFEIGRQLYNAEVYESADEWLALAIKMFDYADFAVREEGNLAKASILDYLSMTQLRLSRYDRALNLAEEAYKLYPEFDHIKANIRKIRKEMSEEIQTTAGTVPKKKKESVDQTQQKYEIGCRGEMKKKPSETKDLYCNLSSGKSNFFKLAPYKVEMINLRPNIYLIHDILNENQINRFIKMSEDNMRTATLLDQYKGIEVAYPTLSSQYFSVVEADAPLIKNLDRRFADLTGLIVNQTMGETLQVSRYDVGWSYPASQTNENNRFEDEELNVMFKVSDKPVSLSDEYGNRVASSIIYLNDVEKGGATVFPELNTVVFPKKGAALLWYNLLPSGKPDLAVQNAGCPVLKGHMTILIKNIRERVQFKARPCALKENDRFD